MITTIQSDQLARLRLALVDTQKQINDTLLPLLQHLQPGEDGDVAELIGTLELAEANVSSYLNGYRLVVEKVEVKK